MRPQVLVDVRLPAPEARFVAEARPFLEHRSLLAGPPTSWLAPLLVPGLRVEAARQKDTRHVFSNAGRPEEGERRLAAWEWARRGEPVPAGKRPQRQKTLFQPRRNP